MKATTMTKQHNHNPPMQSADSDVVDPVCGMTISAGNAAGTHTHGGTTYYFCNPSCLEKIKSAPGRYLQPKRTEPISEKTGETEFTCPIDPETHQSWPRACPK